LDGLQFSALDLVQNGLAGASEALCGLIEREEVVGDVWNEPGANLWGDPDPPRRVRGGLLSWQHASAQPSIDRRRGDTELARGLRDAEQAAVAIGCRGDGDPEFGPQGSDARLVEHQAGAGPAALFVQDRRDLAVIGVSSEPADQVDRVLVGAVALGPAP
jgi:hypothetical protein